MRTAWFEVRYCGDIYAEEFDTLAEARRRAKELIADDEDDVHIVKVETE